jgi:hypothetical protein
MFVIIQGKLILSILDCVMIISTSKYLNAGTIDDQGELDSQVCRADEGKSGCIFQVGDLKF